MEGQRERDTANEQQRNVTRFVFQVHLPKRGPKAVEASSGSPRVINVHMWEGLLLSLL